MDFYKLYQNLYLMGLKFQPKKMRIFLRAK